MLVHVIADYGVGDLAFAEVVQRIEVLLPDAEFVLTPVPAFATLAAGFCIAQLALNPAPPSTLVYHNVAPRQDDEDARTGNSGEKLAFARLPTGVHVIGVNSGYTFSFLRDAAEELRWAAVAAEGSQFRSRDLFPQAAAAIVLGKSDCLGEAIKLDDIPAVPNNQIAYIDGYGNLKTTVRADQKRPPTGTIVAVTIGSRTEKAVFSDNSFGVPVGQLAFAPGSSGWTVRSRETRWMELFLRGGSAWEAFGRPPVGSRIHLEWMI
jgi:S-adenosyl-l-methionine hydroxide adenosyltransferase